MPAKGWKKNDNPNSFEEKSLVSIEDLIYPKATILKLARSVFENQDNKGSNAVISGDSTLALQRAATVFVNYIGEYARQVALSKDKIVVTANDVMEALNSMGFEEFVPELNSELNAFNKLKKEKKLVNKQKKLERTKEGNISNNAKEENDSQEDHDEDEDNNEKMEVDEEELHNSDSENEEEDPIENPYGRNIVQPLETEMKELAGTECEEEANYDAEEENLEN